jgi:DNA primase
LARIPEATISEIRSRVDVVDLVGRYVQLKKAGRNFKGLCPFHDEKTPSFNVSPDKQIFHCFGCQAGGDVVGFLMQHENLTFPEAVRTLAGECGVEVPEERGDPEARGISERVFEANDVAQRLYVDALASAEGEAARAYLAKRGLPVDDVRELGVGFAPDRWDTVERALRGKQIDGALGEKAGLLAPRKSGDGHYDRLRGRVTFPIYDVRRRIVGFGGRALGADQEPKYLNTPESPVFRKRESFYGFPWALEAIRRSERVIVCEGYFDRIALHRAGLGEALATCGTALTREHARNLRRRTRTVVLLFDGDEAGQNATEKALEVLLPEGLRVRAALLPDGQDPDDFLAAQGEDALRTLVDQSPDALELAIRRAVRAGVVSPADKADAVAHVAPLIGLVADAVEREAYVRRLALTTDSSEAAVGAIVRAARKGEAPPAEVELATPRARLSGPEERHLELLCSVLLRHPALATSDTRDRIETQLPDDEWRRVALALLGASENGNVDADGAIDHHHVAESLGVDARALLFEVVAGDETLDPDAKPEQVVHDVLAWFERRSHSRQARQTTQQLREAAPSELSEGDAARLLAQKQRELEAKRVRAQAPKTAGPPR